MTADLVALNKKERRPVMILRLLADAEAGKPCEVSIIDALEFRRDQYSLTKGEFASLLGLSAARYSDILAGRVSLGLVATKRAYAIGVPAEVLLQPKD